MLFLKQKASVLCFTLMLLVAGFILRSCSGEGNGKIYTIGRDPTWYPSNLMGREKNLTAFSDDLLLTIAKAADIRCHIVNSSRDTLMSGLLIKDYDAILIQITPSKSLEQTMEFSDSYFPLGPVLVTEIDSTAQTIEDMNGKTIGIEKGSSLVFETQKYPSLIVTSYDNIFKALGALDNDKIDGVLMEILPAYIYTKSFYPTRLKVATKPLTNDGLRLVTLRKGANTKLIEIFNDGLKKMQEDGTYDAMIQKWGFVNVNKVGSSRNP